MGWKGVKVMDAGPKDEGRKGDSGLEIAVQDVINKTKNRPDLKNFFISTP
jgi:hypothetical protein